MSPLGIDWGHIAAWTDCIAAGRKLFDIADLFRAEAKQWTHPAARAILGFDAELCEDWARAVTLTADLDGPDRLEALWRAEAQISAARLQLRRWYDRRADRDEQDSIERRHHLRLIEPED